MSSIAINEYEFTSPIYLNRAFEHLGLSQFLPVMNRGPVYTNLFAWSKYTFKKNI